MEASDPYGAKAWNQRIGKEMGSAVQFHKATRTGAVMPRRRNPITHEQYDRIPQFSDTASSAPSMGSCGSKEAEFRDRINNLERVLLEERVNKRLVEQELEQLRAVCRDKYSIDAPHDNLTL